MSFLSIAFLAALPLAAAPLLLHFFDRRRNVVVEWGAMQFLQEAATRRTSARRLKEWLLLLLRIAALAALVMALARPLVPGDWFGAAGRGETIVVVDNSMSTMRTSDGQRVFEQLIDRASQTLNSLEVGDSVRVLLSSPYPVWMTAGSVRVDPVSRSKLTEQLAALRPNDGSSDLLASLFTAVQADAEPTLQQRRVVLLSDGQASDWKLEDADGWSRLQDVLSSAVVPTQLDVVELDAAAGANNLGVDDIRSSRTVAGVNQSIAVTAQIRNHARQTSPGGKLTWSVDGQQQQHGTLPAIDGGAARDFTWKHTFNRAGVFAITCQVEAEDDLAPDNQATVVVEVVQRIPVLLVEGSGELAETQRDAFFVQAALGQIQGDEDSQARPVLFEPHAVTPQRLETIDLNGFRAVVVPNLTELSQRSVARLQTFVSDGGGLWLALGPRTDADAFNHYLYNDGNGLSPLGVAGVVVDDPDDEEARTRINPFGKDHPAVTELADVERLDLGDVKVTGRLRFRASISYDDVSVLLDLTNGDPLAVENYQGRGRVIVQSIPLRYQWSDLALSQSFVVMVHDWLAYLVQPSATRLNLAPGDPISLQLANADFTEATLTLPHGNAVELAAEPASKGVVFRSSRTFLPGDYSLELGLTGDRIPFHVARDPRESNLDTLAAVDHGLLTDTVAQSRNVASRHIAGAHQNEPVWPLLLMVVIVLITGELLLSGVIARQRFGSDSIAETTEDWREQADRVATIGRPGASPPTDAAAGSASPAESSVVQKIEVVKT